MPRKPGTIGAGSAGQAGSEDNRETSIHVGERSLSGPGEGETVFSVSPSPIKFGAGALRAAGVDVAVLGDTRCEPNSDSFEAAAAFAREGNVDGFVSLGGGSVMDTAKAANLLSTYPDELIAYVNAPIGRAKPIPGKLKPHIACPSTCGTGSETTGITIVDLKSAGLKTGIASPLLKPSHAIVDPTTTEALPGGVVAASGFDVLSHAVESYTARPYASRPRPAHPSQRPPYQGSTPHNVLLPREVSFWGSAILAAPGCWGAWVDYAHLMDRRKAPDEVRNKRRQVSRCRPAARFTAAADG